MSIEIGLKFWIGALRTRYFAARRCSTLRCSQVVAVEFDDTLAGLAFQVEPQPEIHPEALVVRRTWLAVRFRSSFETDGQVDYG